MSSNDPAPAALRLVLVAMPWSRRDRPSAALASLAAYVARERHDMAVECRSEFLEIAAALGDDVYDTIAGDAYEAGEMLYTSLLYPEKQDGVRDWFEGWARERLSPEPEAGLFDRIRAALAAHLEAVADAIAPRATVVGLTTSFGQLFANIALARAIKRRAPHVKVILGGPTISARMGPSVLAEYDVVDYLVQGEGELPLVVLLDAIGRGAPAPASAGILSRGEAAEWPNGVPLRELRHLDELPVPDYDEYAERAEQYGVAWQLPLEGSRGCWWDRTKRTGDAESTCYFCNLNIQWGGYREKSPQRIAAEMAELSERHKVLSTFFVDNIIRHKGIEELALAIQSLGRDFEIFYEMRANVRPHEVLAMWEAGLRKTQFGIEALSTSLLQRIGKGTTTLQNLQAMRLCTELGITNTANLITDFPGSTAVEVEETCATIEAYALSFEPLTTARFTFTVDSTVDTLRTKFGITNVRNAERYRRGLPDAVWSRLVLDAMDFDVDPPAASWAPVREVCARWVQLHASARGPLLFYRDGGTFLNIEDERFGDFRSGTFHGLEREIYLFCTQARSREQIAGRFSERATDAAIDVVLEQFVASQIMFREQDRHLSLAVAPSPAAAARRIREAHREDQARRKRVVRLPMSA